MVSRCWHSTRQHEPVIINHCWIRIYDTVRSAPRPLTLSAWVISRVADRVLVCAKINIAWGDCLQLQVAESW
jgi:hypothetical protein